MITYGLIKSATRSQRKQGGVMSLPYDVARCAGVQYGGEWREGCEYCLRRTSPVDPVQQVWMAPPEIIAFECEFLIEAVRPGGEG